jgi:molybdenum-dependent DNA-binding transcriptional regulator ModE
VEPIHINSFTSKNKTMETYYTYAYLREDGTPYYIGKGKGRRAFHKNHNVPRPNKDKILFLKQNLSEENALKHEKYLISILNNLLNKKSGGKSGSRSSLTEEHKNKISTKLKIVRPLQIITEDHKKNISNSVKSHWQNLTIEQREQRNKKAAERRKEVLPLKTNYQYKYFIDNKSFNTLNEVSEVYSVSLASIRNRCLSKNFPNWKRISFKLI